jgi:hypothetical protein
VQVIALRLADCSRVSNDQAIFAGDELLLDGIDERFLDFIKSQIGEIK